MHPSATVATPDRAATAVAAGAPSGPLSAAPTILSFEGFRGVAALTVALYHTRYVDAAFLRSGYLFVDLFFVLSGFVMCWVYEQKLVRRAGAADFVWRRIGRLYPLFLFATGAYIAARLLNKILFASGYDMPLLGSVMPAAGEPLALPAYGNEVDAGGRVLQVLLNLLLLHGVAFTHIGAINGPAWSISTEFYTYLVFCAVCYLVSNRWRMTTYLLLGIGGWAITVWASLTRNACLVQGHCFDVFDELGLVRCVGGFFIGCALAHVRWQLPPGRWLDAAQIAVVSLLVWVLHAGDATKAINFLAPPLMALAILTIARDRGIVARALSTRPMQFLGRVSYSVYLMHLPLIHVFDAFVPRVESTLLALIFLAVLLAVSEATYRWIEDPARKWFNAQSGRLQRRRAAN